MRSPRMAVFLTVCGLLMASAEAVAQVGPLAATDGKPAAPATPAEPIEILDEPKTVDPATLVPPPLAALATVTFDDASLKDIVNWLQTEQKLPALLDKNALTDEGILVSEPVNDRLRNDPVYMLLDRLAAMGVAWYMDEGLLHITTSTKAEELMTTVSYNFGDLFDAGFKPQALLSAIENSTSGAWEDVDGVGGEMVLLGDVLFVRHTFEVHREIAGLLAAIRKHGRRTFTLDAPQHATLRDKLLQPISVDFQGTPLSTVATELSRLTGADVRLDRAALRDEGVRERTPVTLKLSDQKFSTILRVLLMEHGLYWVLEDGVLRITTQTAADELQKAAVYDVRDLCRDADEAAALQRAVQSQTRGHWEQRSGAGGTIEFAQPGVMVVRQTEQTQDEVLQLLENYRTALRASKPRERIGIDPQEVITRYYRLPTVMTTDLMIKLPRLLHEESWQSEAHPNAKGALKSIPSRPGPLDSAGQGGTPIVVEHSILIVQQTREIHKELGQLLQKLETGDPLIEPEAM
ncbi:MAG: hypothetical protein SH850_08270, partial [Planctomycetaceae bacterium]|nr:hypothetical protein [Planctomycetaceae bacterium]